MNANIEKINELMKIIRELHEKIAKLENIAVPVKPPEVILVPLEFNMKVKFLGIVMLIMLIMFVILCCIMFVMLIMLIMFPILNFLY